MSADPDGSSREVRSLQRALETALRQVNKGQGACFPCHFDADAKQGEGTLEALLSAGDTWNVS